MLDGKKEANMLHKNNPLQPSLEIIILSVVLNW